MKLEQKLYDEIVKAINIQRSRQVLKRLREQFPNVHEDVLRSINAQVYQRKIKKNHYLHFSADTSAAYYRRYRHAVQYQNCLGSLLFLADQVDLAPALMAKLILEQYLAETSEEPIPKNAVSQLLRNPSLISDPYLSYDVQMCVVNDDNYGPISDAIKQSLGHEYECRLKREMDVLGVPYLDEDQLRMKGYDKTPDLKLEVPIAIDGRVVNWIESKASFGDVENHNGYLRDQYWSYWNRFGPGIVIYWFGFIDELNYNCDKGIILDYQVPQQHRVTFLSP